MLIYICEDLISFSITNSKYDLITQVVHKFRQSYIKNETHYHATTLFERVAFELIHRSFCGCLV